MIEYDNGWNLIEKISIEEYRNGVLGRKAKSKSVPLEPSFRYKIELGNGLRLEFEQDTMISHSSFPSSQKLDCYNGSQSPIFSIKKVNTSKGGHFPLYLLENGTEIQSISELSEESKQTIENLLMDNNIISSTQLMDDHESKSLSNFLDVLNTSYRETKNI